MVRHIAQQLDPETPFLNDPAAQKLCRLLAAAGHVALFVGGCVRNTILGLPASDIDIATDALPERVIQIVQAAGCRAVPTGLAHGTVTVIVEDRPFEVTTFRRDVATDGRRAVVAFSESIVDDARRRDFTMNAIYADRYGVIVDPLDGLPDLRARHVRFIEDASLRIREDYLRTLRYFRFHACYAAPGGGWDADALAGIAANLDGLDTLSAERVGVEMIKLLSTADPAPAVAVMAQTGVLARVLPGADPQLVALLVHLEETLGLSPDPMARLAALGGDNVAKRLRLSRADQKRLEMICTHSVSALGRKAIGYLAGIRAGTGAVLLRAAMSNTPADPGWIAEISEGAEAVFPIRANDFPLLKGESLGAGLATLKSEWLASNLAKTKNELLKP